MSEKKKSAIIIGTGIAGLATAVRLAVKGYDIQVFEANSYPGGKLSEFSVGDFRFDAGPSLFTMPQYVDELFELAGKKPGDFFSYQKLETVCKYFWEDGTVVEGYGNLDKFANEVEKNLGVKKNKTLQFFKKAKAKYELTGTTFLEHSLHRSKTWLTKKVLKSLLLLPTLDLFSSMHQVHNKSVEHPKMVQLLDRFATYNGSSPYQAPGLLSMIPHFEHGIGAYYPNGGMISITNSIFNLAKSLGVRFQFNALVDEILMEGKKAKGVLVDGKRFYADKIVSNMDVFYTYKKLLPNLRPPKRQLNQERSTSALIFYWGINRKFANLKLHNILFSENYNAEFDALGKGEVCSDPTIYINISSKHSKQDAPPGSENWFVMINVPYSSNQDWESLTQRIKQNAIEKINRILEVNLEDHIVTEAILDPITIESKTSSYRGALYGTSSNSKFSAFLRHANFNRSIQNLYFCGGSVHPGGGIPLCLLSAKIVDDLISEGY